MELAKLSSNGQITVPIAIRKKLNANPGDKILFYQNAAGEIVVDNASSQALMKAQRAFAGLAEELGVKDEEDVQKLVDELRQ